MEGARGRQNSGRHGGVQGTGGEVETRQGIGGAGKKQ
jgi:hypothetical protein